MAQKKLVHASEGKYKIKIISGDILSNVYYDVIKIRKEVDPRWTNNEFTYDSYSTHYCLYVNEIAAGCITITWAKNGKLDCEEFYPASILNIYRSTLVSACKFRIKKEYSWGVFKNEFTSKSFIREVLKDQISKGALIDLIDSEESLAPYYQRMGYIACNGYDFFHPILKTKMIVMFLPADPNIPSVAQEAFKNLKINLSSEKVLKELEREERKLSNT